MNENLEVINTIKNKNWDKLKSLLANMLEAEIVDIIDYVDDDDTKYRIFSLIDSIDIKAYVFSELNLHIKEYLIMQMKDYDLKILIHSMSPDDRTALFEEISFNIKNRISALIYKSDLKEINKLLSYPEDSIGRIMTTEYLSIKLHYTVEDTINQIRKFGKDSEAFEVIYVINDDGVLFGYVLLKDLLIAKLSSSIDEIMYTDIISLSVYSDKEEAVLIGKKYDLLYIPVVDDDNILIGIVTIDDIFDIAEEEDTEDFHKLGAVGVSDDFDSSIKNASVLNLYHRRITWLFILIFINIISGYFINFFEGIISKYISLILFLPLLIDSAGNAGAQSSTLIIRSLSVGDVKKSDWFFMFFKEIFISLLLGATMSIAVALLAIFRGGIKIAIVVAISMTLVVTIGSLIGLSLPFLFVMLKKDPTTSSVPLVTSICDICGTAIYLLLATILLSS